MDEANGSADKSQRNVGYVELLWLKYGPRMTELHGSIKKR